MAPTAIKSCKKSSIVLVVIATIILIIYIIFHLDNELISIDLNMYSNGISNNEQSQKQDTYQVIQSTPTPSTHTVSNIAVVTNTNKPTTTTTQPTQNPSRTTQSNK